MEDASIRRSDLPAVPTDILKLNEMENDIFLDIFTTTYSKVVDALAKKKKKMVNENFISKTRNNMRALGSLASNVSNNQAANDRGSGQNFFGPDN